MNTAFDKISFKPWNNLEGIREPGDIENNIQSLTKLRSRMENQASPEKQAFVEAQLGRFDQLKVLRNNLTKFLTDRTNLELEYKTLKEKGDTTGLKELDEKIGNIEDQIRTVKDDMTKLESSIEGLKKNIVTLQREIITHQPTIDQISQQYNTPAESSSQALPQSEVSPTNSRVGRSYPSPNLIKAVPDLGRQLQNRLAYAQQEHQELLNQQNVADTLGFTDEQKTALTVKTAEKALEIKTLTAQIADQQTVEKPAEDTFDVSLGISPESNSESQAQIEPLAASIPDQQVVEKPTENTPEVSPQVSPEASPELSREQKRAELDKQINKIRGEYLTAVAYKEQARRAKGLPSYEDMMRAEEYYQTYQNLKNERINLYASDEVHQVVTEYTDPKTGDVTQTTKNVSMRYKLIADETSALNSDRIRTGVQEGKRPAYIRVLDKINKAVGIPGALVSGALISAGMHPEKAAKIAPWVTSGTIAFTGAITGGFGLLGAAMAVPGALATTAAVSTAVQGLDTYIIKPIYHDPEQHDVVAVAGSNKKLSGNDLAQAEKLEQARVHGSRAVVRNTVKATAALGLGSWFGSLFGSQTTSASESSGGVPVETPVPQINTTPDTATGTETSTEASMGGSDSNYVENTVSTSTTSSTQESVISSDDQITPEQQAQLDEMDRKIAEANKQTEAILAAKAAKTTQTTQVEQTSTGITGRGQVYATTDPSQVETARLYNQASQNNLEATKVNANAYIKGTIINNATGLLVRGVDTYLYLKTLAQNQSGIMGGGGIGGGVNMIQPTPLGDVSYNGSGITGGNQIGSYGGQVNSAGGNVSNIKTID